MKRIVRETDAVSWAPSILIEAELRAGTLAALPFAPPWARLSYGVIRQADRPATPAVEAFISELRSAEKKVASAAGPASKRRRRRA